MKHLDLNNMKYDIHNGESKESSSKRLIDYSFKQPKEERASSNRKVTNSIARHRKSVANSKALKAVQGGYRVSASGKQLDLSTHAKNEKERNKHADDMRRLTGSEPKIKRER